MIAATLERRLHPGGAVFDIAAHTLAATPFVEPQVAMVRFRAAGQAAGDALAFEDSANWFAAAADAASRSDQDAFAVPDLMIRQGHALVAAGEREAATEVLLRVADAARTTEDASGFVAAALALSGESPVALLDPTDPAISLLEEASRLVGPNDERRAACLSRLVVAGSSTLAADRMEQLSSEALGVARRLADPPTLAGALHARLVASIAPGESPAAGLAQELAALGRASSRHDWTAWALPVLARCAAERGAIDDADAHFAELAAIARATRNPAHRLAAAEAGILTATVRGDYVAAEDASRHWLRCARPAIASREAVAGFRRQLTFYGLLQGRFGDLYPPDEEPDPPPFLHPTMRLLMMAERAAIAAASGDPDQARLLLAELTSGPVDGARRDRYWPSAVWLLCHACRRAGDPDSARRLYDTLAPYVGSHLYAAAMIYLGAAHHHLGLLALTFGDDHRAVKHLDEALDQHRRLDAASWSALTLEALSTLAVRPPHPTG